MTRIKKLLTFSQLPEFDRKVFRQLLSEKSDELSKNNGYTIADPETGTRSYRIYYDAKSMIFGLLDEVRYDS